MSNYPSGTDMSYFDDVKSEETDVNGVEQATCGNCGEEIDVMPDGANIVGESMYNDGEYQWYAFDFQCPLCEEISDFGYCD